jgi:gas vesicle protein
MDSNRAVYDRLAGVLILAIGGVVGATFGLLFAPRSGSELRKNAWEKVKDSARRVKETVSPKTKEAEYGKACRLCVC